MRRLLTVLIFLATLLLLPLLALRSEPVMVTLARWAVDQFSELRLVLRNPTINLSDGKLGAAELHLYPKDLGGPPLLSILDFAGSLTVEDILRGTLKNSLLSAGQVILYVSDKDSTDDPAPMRWLQYLRWLPTELAIDQIHLITDSENIWIFPLQNVTGERKQEAVYELFAQAQYDGEPLDIVLTVTAIREGDKFTGIDLLSRFTAPASGSEVLLSGGVKGTTEDFQYDLLLEANYTKIEEFTKGFQLGNVLQGSLNITGQLKGDTRGFLISEAQVLLDNMPEYGIEAAGKLNYPFSGENQLSLHAAGELASLGYLLNWFEMDMSEFGRAQGSATISGSLENPAIEDFRLRTENSNGLTVSITGALESMSDATTDTQKHNEVRFDIQAPQLAALQRWTGPLPVEIGPWQVSGRLLGNRQTMSIDNLIFQNGNRGSTALRIEGAIGEVSGMASKGNSTISNVALHASLYAPNTANIADLLSITLPHDFEVTSNISITGNGELLTVANGSIKLESENIQVHTTQLDWALKPAAEHPITKLKTGISASVSDISALSRYTDKPIPSLGPLAASGVLDLRGNQLQLTNVSAVIASDFLHIKSEGKVDDIKTLSGLALDFEFEGIETRELIARWFDGFDYSEPMGALTGSFSVTNPSGDWRIGKLGVESEDDQGPVYIRAFGEIGNLAEISGVDLEGTLKVRKPELLEELTGLRMNPASATIRARSDKNKLDLNIDGHIGDSDFNLLGKIKVNQLKTESLELALNSSLVRLEDIGLQADLSSKEAYKPSEQLQAVEPTGRLERLLKNSPRFPTDISLHLQDIIGDNTNIESFNMHVTGQENRYTLRRFSLTYDQSLAEVRGIIDLNPTPPFASIAGEGIAIPLSTLGTDLGMQTDVSGKVTVRGGVTASGKNTEELLQSLDGSLAVALEDAVIAGAAYDVLATDLLAWVYSGASREKSTYIDCTMGDFLLSNGIADSDSLYLETARMVATGEAEIDLVKERLDITITPRSKSRSLQVPSSIRLRGKFDSPKATISPIMAAVDTYTQVITLVPKLVLSIFGIKKETKKRQRPCGA